VAFLAPWFLAGLAALALPVLLHLRKNRPKQTVAFSSLMFLDPSPPVTKRRSRLQDILLLLLRCLALALLILAFSRPFFPAKEDEPVASDGAVMHFILLDTSASMRGEALEQALLTARGLIGEIPATDWIALATFSDRLRPLISPERARELAGNERKSTALALLDEVVADWHATRLDTALQAAVAAAGEEMPLKIHLIGDLQKGASLDRLRDETRPDSFQVVTHPVPRKESWTNAGIRMLPPEKQLQRARVTNSEGSAKSDFTLSWSGSPTPIQISVAPGESAVFEAPPELPAEGTATLAGDDFPFDNEAAWTTPVRPVVKIWQPDPSDLADTSESAYFLKRAMQPTPDYSVEIVADLPAEAPALIVSGGTTDDIAVLRPVIEAGATVLFTVRDPASAAALATLLEIPAPEATEAVVRDHARLGEIDFKSTVFAPFADARYSDFSGIRFWKYRVLPPELLDKARILARFDSGDPAWLSFPLGEGTVHVLTTTWRPADSQLALTTKFPPLLHSLFGRGDGPRGLRLVGHAGIETPGIHATDDGKIALQLDPAESELTPLPESELRALGLPLDAPANPAADRATTLALSRAEQESRQRIGWWILIAAAFLFLTETLWAALAANRQTPVAS
jgi:hypothetical protein